MRNIKIIYRYDGSMFYGFQRQPDKKNSSRRDRKASKYSI